MALAEAVTSQDVVIAVAERVLPPFDATGLLVLTLESDRLHLVGSVGYPPEIREMVHGTPMRGRRLKPNAHQLRTGTPQFGASSEEFVARFPELADLVDMGLTRAWAFLPLIASGQTIGVCVISFDGPRRLSEDERTLLTALSGLVAQALERARLYDAEHTRARELQRGLLPRELPSLPAVTAAARYLAAGHGPDVGGDWYDIIPLSADRVALVIGDVMGHGLSEAATMGRLRTAVRTLSDLELPPDEILVHLNDIVSDLGDDFYATCLYAVYDPTTRHCSLSLAGHPPPAVVRPDATVDFPDLAPDPPLGAADPPFDTADLELPEGSLLVLYTDGLIESAARDIDQGMDHLARALTDAMRLGETNNLEQLCDVVTDALLPAQQPSSDDAALLIARPRRLNADNVASWPLPEAPQAAGQARGYIREQLAAWRLDELAMTTELLASELVGNVVRHAKGPMTLRLIRSHTLICEVADGSLTTPHIRRSSDTDEGGRGLQLVAALSQRWGTRFTADGKCIWTEQALT
jgi:serine phosphatase RsbU (regulator of sigma subunit)